MPLTALYCPSPSATPKGRKTTARGKITELFLNLLYASFFEGGAEAIRKVRDENPAAYLKIVMMLIPKQVTGEDGDPIKVELASGVKMLEQRLKSIAARETAVTVDTDDDNE